MRPFIAQINAMIDKQSNTVPNGPRNAVLRPVRDRGMVRSSNNGAHEPTRTCDPTAYVHQKPTKSQPAPNGVRCEPVAPLCGTIPALTGDVLAWATYRLPYKKDVVCKSQGHREYLEHLLSIILMIKYASTRPAAPLQYFWVNDNKGALAWAEKHRCASLAS